MTTLTGRLLRVDLTNRTSRVEDVPLELNRRYISARGLGVRYLFDELKPRVDPLGPENKLIFGCGVLGGTGLQGFSKWVALGKSPLTGTIFRSITGGNFGPWLKYAGFDLLIIEGRSSRPLYLYLDQDGLHFLEADDLWGLDHRRVQTVLKERHRGLTETACIGSAGERLVRYAVITSGERTASRGGLGTVMGAKNLKAVAINIRPVKPAPANPEAFKALITRQVDILREHPRRKNMNTLGTPYITTVLDKLGVLPVRNFQAGRLPEVQAISGQVFLEIKQGPAGCHLCQTRCGGWRQVTAGPFSGSAIDGPEYESIFAFGPVLGLADKEVIINANALCDYFGLDTISTGVCLALAFELYEKGLISKTDTDGLELTWGNPAVVLPLIEKIARREGLGRLLGEGVKRAAEDIGRGAETFAMHIKGLELPGYEPRAVKGYALSLATSNIGGSHMYGRPRDELSGKVDPLTEHDKGRAIAQAQKEQAVEDSLIACTFGNSGLDMDFYGQALIAATGLSDLGCPENLIEIGERIVTLERCFNLREGFSREDDRLPTRLTSEPLLEAGPATGQVVRNLDHLLDEYYEAFGYTKGGGPTTETLKRLGLDQVQSPCGGTPTR